MSVDSGLGLDWQDSPKLTIHGQEYDGASNSYLEFLHWSPGLYEAITDLDNFNTLADIPISQTYLRDLCDESPRTIFSSFDDLRRHKETKHEITDDIQQLSWPVPKEAVSTTPNEFQEPSTASEPGCVSQVSSNANVSPSQRSDLPPMSKGIRSPLK
ncbi:hypothetical protein Aspvir_003278 [Aspergillus viridinutans]|uniref:Uncharacterized protein n=1 Tax=Aspergillus viridinutans TaxID=75553 RepID=A0A9P3C4V2_ASPVI|nr:uncharacterized protein Aspvir_003278 [Aspergillus viridinutans]GIK07612.1 hypothetical protein Aspvir_003278 [Aspergillus viridinutans]